MATSNLCVSNWVETLVAASLRKVTDNFDVCFHNRTAAEQMVSNQDDMALVQLTRQKVVFVTRAPTALLLEKP